MLPAPPEKAVTVSLRTHFEFRFWTFSLEPSSMINSTISVVNSKSFQYTASIISLYV
jgi:hypothetical protein